MDCEEKLKTDKIRDRDNLSYFNNMCITIIVSFNLQMDRNESQK